MSINLEDIGLRGGVKTPAQVLAQLVHDHHTAAKPGANQDLAAAGERLRAIQLAGATAAMFGGLAAMQRLFADVEAVDARAARALDTLWDFVGEWLS